MFINRIGWKPAGAGLVAEDLSGYTEYDPASKISKTSSRVTLNGLGTAVDAYVYKDFGYNYFNAIDLRFTLYIGSSSVNGCYCNIGFGPNIDDIDGWSSPFIIITAYKSGGLLGVYLQTFLDFSPVFTINANTTYYLRVVRAASSGSIKIYLYSDSAMTNLIDSDTLPAGLYTTDRFRYFYATCSYNTGGSGELFYGYVENFYLL